MSMAIRDRTETTLSEINVTPLVDVMLVLLIIFMVTAPMLSSSIPVNLQTASSKLPASPKERVVVTIDEGRKVYVGDRVYPLDQVAMVAKGEIEKNTLIEGVAIRGDKKVDYGTVLEVIDLLRKAGIKDVGLVMNPPSDVAPRRGRP